MRYLVTRLFSARSRIISIVYLARRMSLHKSWEVCKGSPYQETVGITISHSELCGPVRSVYKADDEIVQYLMSIDHISPLESDYRKYLCIKRDGAVLKVPSRNQVLLRHRSSKLRHVQKTNLGLAFVFSLPTGIIGRTPRRGKYA